jgi:hypothetical protein
LTLDRNSPKPDLPDNLEKKQRKLANSCAKMSVFNGFFRKFYDHDSDATTRAGPTS